MTFDGPINTTYGEMVAQVRDKISSMANWSVKADSTEGGASFGTGDHVVFTTPEGSDVRLNLDNNANIGLQHGPNWDEANSQWGDQYSNSWSTSPIHGQDYDEARTSDQVRYWVEYVDGKGFAFAATREEGDGQDRAMAMGISELTRLWDYTTAQVRESKYVALVLGRKSRTDYDDVIQVVNSTFEGGASDETHHGKGEVNADGNNDNYPMVETTLQASSKYEGALVGSHDLWIRDQSGDRSAHLDTVTNGGVDQYKIFKEGLPRNIGIRME